MLETAFYLLLSAGAVYCAYRAIIARHLLSSTLFLACVSAVVAIALYLLGAQEVAVIELSVGAGLVTVLLVYALSVVGEDTLDKASLVPPPLALLLVGAVLALGGWMLSRTLLTPGANQEVLLAEVLWKQRALDVWVQVALIFSGVMGVLGLLSEKAFTGPGGLLAVEAPEKEDEP
jgi:uncharacterized MnhB-related membrane protein